jgi:hypothetical protein
MAIAPGSPFVVMPVLNTSPTLIPFVPAFKVLTTIEEGSKDGRRREKGGEECMRSSKGGEMRE